MDRASIIRFSDTVRDRIYEETKNRAANYGIFPDKIQDVDKEFEDSIVIGGRVFNRKIKRQREQLVREVREKGYDQLIDEVTYTWFNRFVALKFMEVNGYLPENVKVFSSNEQRKTEPDILSKSLKLDFLNIDRNTVIDMKSAGKDEDLYKYLTLSLCNYLNKIMPFLFENIEDHTELLFPDKLLHTDSILRDINSIIKEEDWKEVEVIGWIYQDYIAQKKDVLIHAKKQYQTNQIATVTQLFTPKWIVRYMVQNSLGRYWLESHPNKELQSKFEFYLESREENYLDKLIDYIDKTLSPENIRFLDPGMGSAHILVYAFDVFYEIYKISGYLDDEIAELILTKNLYGLEIDNRATQLAGFALLMKARQYDKRLFEKKIELNIAAIQETNNLTDEDIKLFAGNNDDYAKVKKLFDTFNNAKTYGSIIKIDEFDEGFFGRKLNEFKKFSNLRKYEILDELVAIIKQARIMTQKYDIAVANPPYLTRARMPDKLKEYVEKNYPVTKHDLFAIFIESMSNLTKSKGQIGIMSPFTWMFIKIYEEFRNYIINQKSIIALIELEYHAVFDLAYVPVCTFTLRNYSTTIKGEYVKLSDFVGAENQPIKTIEAIKNPNVNYRFTVNSQEFSKIPGFPIAYWVSNKKRKVFEKGKSLDNIAEIKIGLASNDNERFLRFWHETSFGKIGFNFKSRDEAKESRLKWFPYNKGGSFRKWYGNNEYILNWENDGYELRNWLCLIFG